MKDGDDLEGGQAEGFKALLANKPMLILAGALACFHLGNGAMLPLYGMAVVGAGKGDAAMFTATTVMVAQAVMIVASLLAMKVAAGRGYWLVLLISFAPSRCVAFLAGTFIEHWGVWPVQALDGIGAGLQSVAVPASSPACSAAPAGQCRAGRGDDDPGRRRLAVARHRRLAGAGTGLSHRLLHPRRLRGGEPGLWIGFAGTLRPACAGGAKPEEAKA